MTQPVAQHTIYQCDSTTAQHIKGIREKIQAVAGHCVHRKAVVHTIDGHIYEGTIVDVKHGCLYLMMPQPQQPSAGQQRFFSPFPTAGYYGNVILPLVLYELLVISLLS